MRLSLTSLKGSLTDRGGEGLSGYKERLAKIIFAVMAVNIVTSIVFFSEIGWPTLLFGILNSWAVFLVIVFGIRDDALEESVRDLDSNDSQKPDRSDRLATVSLPADQVSALKGPGWMRAEANIVIYWDKIHDEVLKGLTGHTGILSRQTYGYLTVILEFDLVSGIKRSKVKASTLHDLIEFEPKGENFYFTIQSQHDEFPLEHFRFSNLKFEFDGSNLVFGFRGSPFDHDRRHEVLGAFPIGLASQELLNMERIESGSHKYERMDAPLRSRYKDFWTYDDLSPVSRAGLHIFRGKFADCTLAIEVGDGTFTSLERPEYIVNSPSHSDEFSRKYRGSIQSDPGLIACGETLETLQSIRFPLKRILLLGLELESGDKFQVGDEDLDSFHASIAAWKSGGREKVVSALTGVETRLRGEDSSRLSVQTARHFRFDSILYKLLEDTSTLSITNRDGALLSESPLRFEAEKSSARFIWPDLAVAIHVSTQHTIPGIYDSGKVSSLRVVERSGEVLFEVRIPMEDCYGTFMPSRGNPDRLESIGVIDRLVPGLWISRVLKLYFLDVPDICCKWTEVSMSRLKPRVIS